MKKTFVFVAICLAVGTALAVKTMVGTNGKSAEKTAVEAATTAKSMEQFHGENGLPVTRRSGSMSMWGMCAGLIMK